MTERDHGKISAAVKKHEAQRRARKVGATRERPRDYRVGLKWGRLVLLAVCMSAGSYGLAQLPWQEIYSKAYASTNRPLSSIAIEGEFRYVAKSTLQALISEKLDGSFVDLDLGAIKAAIESNPWVANVTIERIWPDRLKLTVKEHYPIARWNRDSFLSRDGAVVDVGDNAALAQLPGLVGEAYLIGEVTKNYSAFAEILKASELSILGLEVDKQQSWTIIFNEGFSLVLGRDNIHDRLENFSYVYSGYLKNKKMNIERIDMRYDQGLAVKWKDDVELVAANQVQR